ncbi:hypothetical protein FOH10_25675 [Nocardia otitidiscaviarum]|uniref:Uncharacterized protein n=1 Tax=Nocardia otitidiscaviarum TaxID=1823 RepID=A0A516NRR4_9NOCA|nr:hypothetical protein [Nocardia otitidiscaviarum]MCP9620813.1 hypothetical protein [Nocardia otitidiscaviarum]QDP81606.1 hypothetical protein FOH10_25675 [Nocardia otitidiscaviarum]
MDGQLLPDGWTIDEIRRRAKSESAVLLDPSTRVYLAPNGSDQSDPLNVDLILDFSGLCLARCVDDAEWYMGNRGTAGEPIFCWSSYGDDLGTAIDNL